MTSNTNKTNFALGSRDVPVKPTRPYTEYNIYFQLEREYILQVELGVKPDLEPDNIFDPERDVSYNGPSLPSRYNGLILPSDWYVPGKEKRRKRKHRKSHGKIGFHELSNKIAASWKNKNGGIDDETRVFCAMLSDMGMLAYKKEMRKYKLALEGENLKEQMMMEEEEKKKTQVDNRGSGDFIGASNFDDAVKIAMQVARNQDSIANNFSDNISTQTLIQEVFIDSQFSVSSQDNSLINNKIGADSSAFESETDLYMSFFDPEPHQANHDFSRSWSVDTNTSSSTASSNTMVDMHDNEILGMWRSSPEPTEHCEQSSRIMQICADAVTSGGFDKVNCASHRRSIANVGEPIKPAQSNMRQNWSPFVETVTSNGSAQVQRNRAATNSAVSMKVGLKKDLESVERMRFLLTQQQSQLRKVTRRSLVACSA